MNSLLPSYFKLKPSRSTVDKSCQKHIFFFKGHHDKIKLLWPKEYISQHALGTIPCSVDHFGTPFKGFEWRKADARHLVSHMAASSRNAVVAIDIKAVTWTWSYWLWRFQRGVNHPNRPMWSGDIVLRIIAISTTHNERVIDQQVCWRKIR